MAKAQLRQYIFTPVAGAGTIEIPGKYDLQQFLVITNTTRNTILYNFADTTYTGTTVSFLRGINDISFPDALDNSDGVTIITLAAGTTTGMASTDTLQILYEQPFQYVRSPEVGTDAFERQRVASPQSLLDADFEYGMQPTKWLTISQQRSVPAIYEIPGTDLTVTAATTDASSGGGGLTTSESVITITTASIHGYSVGQPITIRGFNSAYTGYDRAEGSFVVYQIINSTSFTYIAKGKVGFTNGDNIWTSFIQLRQGGFYSGSNINAVLNTTATATSGVTYQITLGSTTGMTQGSPITFNTINTNAFATNASTGYISVGTTVGMATGMPVTFSGTPFGGLLNGVTYYITGIINTSTITISLASGGSNFTPSATVSGGNMAVVGGGNFGNLTSGTQYYISGISGNQITVSLQQQYTTTITGTNALSNGVYFSNYILNGVSVGGTTNMVVGETVSISGTTIGNLLAGTYYIYAILDSNYAQLSLTSPTSLNGLILATQTTAVYSGSPMNVTVGTNVVLTNSTGYLWAVAISPPTITYITPSSVASFAGTISGKVLTVSSVTSGVLAPGQGLSSGTATVPSATSIIIQLTPTGASPVVSPTLTAGGTAGTYSFTVNSPTNIVVGQIVSGTGIPNSTFVTGIVGSVITLSNVFSSAGSGTYNFYTAYQQGTYSISQSATVGSSSTFSAVNVNPTITVNTTSPHGFTPGETINVVVNSENGTNNNTLANGPFFVEAVTSPTTFTYTARGAGVITGTVSAQVYARPDSFYSHRPFDGGVQLGTGGPGYAAQAIRMSKKYIRYQSGKAINFNTGLLMAPNYFVRSAVATGQNYATGLSITVANTNGSVVITSGTYVQGQALIISNVSLNGAVGLTAGTYYIAVGGTGTSITLASSYANAMAGTAITSVTQSGSLTATAILTPVLTITTDDVDHGCQQGTSVTLSGIITTGYNGTYTVVNIIDERTLQVLANQTLGAPTGLIGAAIGDPCLLSLNNWYGAVVRSGTYDEQNGVFFQYDGQVVSVVKRSSTFQLAGTFSVVVGSGQVIGVNTRFTSQLFVGDKIVIRGMSHTVIQVISDTLMYINPQWRGYSNAQGIKGTKTVDRIIPQSQWNVDRMDGSNSIYNPSGYQIIPTKMQMVAMQWTWYGAGFIDWMMRGPEGKYVTVHRLRNNNLNNEAWMRAGNMPVRYEVQNEGARSFIVGSSPLGVSDTTVTVFDSTYFPLPTLTACTIYIDNELITYKGKINTQATATSATGNTVTVGSTTNMAVGQPIVFMSYNSNTNNLGNIQVNTTYYVNTVIDGATITLATSLANVGVTVMTQVNAAATGTVTSLTINALTGLTRAVTIVPWASGGYRTFTAGAAASHAVQTGVVSVNGCASPIVSHWGAAFIEDGGFDADRSYIFNYQVTNVPLTTKKTTAFAIRLAPSVSNALSGDLGARELINRASFLLQQLESSSGSGGTNAAIVVEGVINPSNFPALTNVSFNSLNSAVNPTGQPSFSQVASGTSIIFSNAVNNYLVCPIYVSAGTSAIPLIGNPTSTTVQVGDDVYFPTSTASLYGLTKVSSLVSTSAGITATISNTTTCSFTANFAGNVMTITAVGSGTVTIGMLLTGTSLGSGTYITNNITGTGSGVGTWGVSVTQTIGNVTVTGTAVIMTVTGTPSGVVTVGSLLAGGSVSANTYIIANGSGTGGAGTYYVNVSQNTTTATTAIYYGITINQVLLAPVILYGGTGTTVQCSRGTYALPGETVFSYINSPANKDALDLSNLKELTNTPIGGRGTYPNGCDTLFINAYITQGAPISTNLVLRWGEAQA